MRGEAQRYLEDVMRYVSAHPDAVSFYRDVGAFGERSLQSAILRDDLKFIDEAISVCGTIGWIVRHPHVVTVTEEVVVRADQAHTYTTESFRRTVRDGKLWKDKRGEMSPEKVYGVNGEFEIRNYENAFIVYLLDRLSRKGEELAARYSVPIRTLGADGDLTQEGSDAETAFLAVKSLVEKLGRLKASDFYRTVSQMRFPRVVQTNVLRHQRAYASCFRFYLRNRALDEVTEEELRVFYFIKLLVALKKAGYALCGNAPVAFDRAGFCEERLSFSSEEFTVFLQSAPEYGGIFFTVFCNGMEEGARNPVANLLIFGNAAGIPDRGTEADVLSLWNSARIENGAVVPEEERLSEDELFSRYLAGKTRLTRGSRKIYRHRCPSCGSRNVIGLQAYFRCADCRTEYAFVGDKIRLLKDGKK